MSNIMYLTLTILGFIATSVHTQELTTKCPSQEWGQFYEKCYLAVNYTQSWQKAKTYCGKYGAILAEPRGHELNDALHEFVATQSSTFPTYWTGYNRILPAGSSPLQDHQAYWSNGQEAGVEEGVWGLNQPDTSQGDCAYVNNADKLWHLGSCDRLMPFLCEMDPCPSGSRDTFMCNGRCLGSGYECDNYDDCGNNLDEQNCANRPGSTTCSYLLQGSSGSFTADTSSGGLYSSNAHCTWLIQSPAGTRINFLFQYVDTEYNTDFVEIYDGGFYISDSSLAVRLSGDWSDYRYQSSLNLALIRFVSDGSTQGTGFALSWTTAYACEYTQLMGYSVSNQETVFYDELRLTSLQVFTKCQSECDEDSQCLGFRYSSIGKSCDFMNMLPILQQDSLFSIYSKTCPDNADVQGSLPLLNSMLEATPVSQQLATVGYPNYYIGNLELEYQITAPANNRITLEVLTVDLGGQDTVTILDQERAALFTLDSNSVPIVLFSTSNMVHVRMDLQTHWKHNGVLLQYRRGCDVSLTGSGLFISEGYGSLSGYGPLSRCTWTLNAPSPDRSVSVRFDSFSLDDSGSASESDYVTLSYLDGTSETYTGQSLQGQSFTAPTSLQVTMETSSRFSGAGFAASFSPGCKSLDGAGYQVSSVDNNYGVTVTLGCATGYYFTGQYAALSTVTLTCGLGGSWSIDPVPLCERSHCGPPPLISDGVFSSSTGPLGGDETLYMCDDGYQMTGSATITCAEDGNWEPEPQCLAPVCADLDTTLPNVGKEVFHGSGTEYNSVVRLSCPEFTELVGPATISCQNGQWDFNNTNPSLCRAKCCAAPVIVKGVLSPSPAYTVNQEITVTCMEGYELSGASTFRCGVDTDLPTCVPKNCSLDGLLDLETVDLSDQLVYNYGDRVHVKCSQGLKLTNVQGNAMFIECTANGTWDMVPECQDAPCGELYHVPGSEYIPSNPCFDYGCHFNFTCQPQYSLHGSSEHIADPLTQTVGDHVVRCGAVYAGLWDYGTLHCKGGHCEDPGYPPSGYLIGESFELDAWVYFACKGIGMEPRVNGAVSTGMVCTRDLVTGQFVWEGEVPVCVDVTPPVFDNCPTEDVKAEKLKAPGFTVPTPRDNKAVKSLIIIPENFDPTMPIIGAGYYYYIAQDYNNNEKTCSVKVVIPEYFVCQNDISTSLEISGDRVLYGNDSQYLDLKQFDQNIVLTYAPSFISVEANAESLQDIYQIEVTATDTQTGNTIDSCTLQFQFTAPPCASWSLYVPNGVSNCNNGVCSVTCNDGFYFMDNPQQESVTVTCTGSEWDEQPVCASSTTSYALYSATYNFKYYIFEGVFDFDVCRPIYQSELEAKLETFAEEMEEMCNSGTLQLDGNAIYVTYNDLVSLQYDMAINRLFVQVEFKIDVAQETLSNSQSLKDGCSSIIESSLSGNNISPYALSSLEGDPAIACNSGDYDNPSVIPSFRYRCVGKRKYANIDGNRYCLTCPVGYDYNNVTCVKCERGTYGALDQDTEVGSACLPCGSETGPDKTGLTDVNQCFFKAKCQKGYHSKDGLEPCTICPRNFYSTTSMSRTCEKCVTDRITLTEGKTDINDCLNQQEVEAMTNGGTPCDPNPCNNGATCTYVYNTYYCTCPEGLTGQLCSSQYTACSSYPCENNKQCIDQPDGTYICNCGTPAEFTGDRCEEDNLGCAPNYCENDGVCHNAAGSHDCKCTSYGGFTNVNSGNCSTPIDQCVVNPCVEGTCVEHGSFYRSCICYPGYTGIDCSIDIDDCDPDLCQNGGTCLDSNNSFTCQCPDFYHGVYCQFVTSCDVECTGGMESGCNTCNMDGTETCDNIGNSYDCNCNPGYTGNFCEIQLSPCNSCPCQHNGTCIEITDETFVCDCEHPWTGNNCETEIDRCTTANQCQNGGTCYSSNSKSICSCPSGHIGSDCSVEYDLCDRVNPCASPDSSCTYTDSGFTCDCEQEYTGENCQTKILSCDEVVCNNGGVCYNTDSGPTCDCADGYDGPRCDTNIKECESNPCGTDQECQDGDNSYTCTCGVTKRGENCDKDVGADFDYIALPLARSRAEVSLSSFGNGVDPIGSISVSFWVRHTQARLGTNTMLTLFATGEDVDKIPQNPRFKMAFMAQGMVAEYNDVEKRRKRATSSVDITYPADIADGYWWHLVMVWSSLSGELTLYINGTVIDQEFFAEGNSLGTRGFVVLGAFDPVTGFTDVENSGEGRLSQVFVMSEVLSNLDIQRLYARTLIPANQILITQRTLMLYYPIVYNSELRTNSLKCVSRTDLLCDINNVVIRTPQLETCPGYTLSKTARVEAPTWDEPSFVGSPPFISNYRSGADLEWGLYGVSYATFDSQNSAAICTMRVYHRAEYSCMDTDGTAVCVGNAESRRCESNCGPNQGLPGIVPRFLTCSMYTMWVKSVETSTYIQPKCSASTPLADDVTLELAATTSGPCATLKDEYMASVRSRLSQFNTEVGNGLCPQNCDGVVTSSSVTCLDDSTVTISINFGLLSPTMAYQGSSLTNREVFLMAVGDSEVFSFASTSDAGVTETVEPQVETIDIKAVSQCGADSQISGNQCVYCGSGTVFDETTSTCTRCPKGTYKDTLVTACTACHESKTTATDGATSIDYCKLKCFRGQYYDAVDLQGCRDCPVGFYQTNTGEFTCSPCPVDQTTLTSGAINSSLCISSSTLTSTTNAPFQFGPATGASQEGGDSGLGTGEIIAIVLGILIALLIIILIIVFCCCKDMLPCMSKKKTVVSPAGKKEGYYANKYGELDMRFVSYNLKDVREKKGRPIDKEPIYEPPLSDDTGSMKTDISIHVPVFNEKMNGSVTKKSLYISNGGQHFNTSMTRSQKSTSRDLMSSRDQMITPHIIAPLTSSPRSMQQYLYDQEEEVDNYHSRSRSKKKKRRAHKHRSSHHHDNRDEATYDADLDVSTQPLPKALSPLPLKVKSKPPSNVFMRPSSPMNRPRTEVDPSQYEDFLNQSPVRSPERSPGRSHDRSRGERLHDRERGERLHDRERDERSHDRSRDERSHDRSRDERSHDRSRRERSHERSRGERSHHKQKAPKFQQFEDDSSPGPITRIVVESDDDDQR